MEDSSYEPIPTITHNEQDPDGGSNLFPDKTTYLGEAFPNQLVTPTPQIVCGVRAELIERFLILIRDNYRNADKAMFFLEHRSGVVNLQGITNVRDVLSHLVTLLDPETPETRREEQISNAEEHLRRSIIEPYEIAVNDSIGKFEPLYKEYKRRVLPEVAGNAILAGAPNLVSIDASLREIGELMVKGRVAKGKNLWTNEWEEGVRSFITAFENLSDLLKSVEEYHYKFDQFERNNKQVGELASLKAQVQEEAKNSKLHHWFGYLLAAVFLVISIIIAISPNSADWVRKLIHLN